jgi:hypothetical protein
MSGFVWPSRAPQATKSIVSPSVALTSAMSQFGGISPTPVSSLNSTLVATSTGRGTTRVQITQIVTVTPSAIASPPTVATSKGRGTTRVQVTHTVTVIPSASANTMSTSCTDNHPAHSDNPAALGTTHVQATHTVTKSPDVTGVIFTLHTPSADAKPTDTSGPNHPAIIGGIVGTIILVVVALVVFAVFRNKRKAKSLDAEVDRPNRSTNDVINTAKRVRSERHRRNRETIELVHQNNERRPSQDPTHLAQAHAWETPFGADNFQPARMRDARAPPRIVTQPSRLRSQRARSRSPVSPVDPECVVREGDVSPLGTRG